MKQNKNIKVKMIINDNHKEFEDFYKRFDKESEWKSLEKINTEKFEFSTIKYYKDSIFLDGFNFKEEDFSKDCGVNYLNKLIEYLNKNEKVINALKVINVLYIRPCRNGINSDQLSFLTKKFENENNIYFYNFGKSFILNKTFFDSGYSIFKNNIAHEAINSFKADNNKRYFYLCKDGKLNDYILDESSTKLPDNYLNLSKTNLINYSKYTNNDDDNKAQYIILQKVSNIETLPLSFKDERIASDYNNIEYYGVNICNIFERNSFFKFNSESNKLEMVHEKNPYISFKISDLTNVKKPKKAITFTQTSKGFENLTSSSCRQFVLEGTNLYKALNKLIRNESNWKVDTSISLSEYINSADYNNDYEEYSLLKIIGKQTKETYFSKLLTFVFANSVEIVQKFFKKYDKDFPNIKEITGVYNEDKNMDVSISFIDESNQEYFVVIENKINANFTPEGEKTLKNYFSQKSYDAFVNEVEDEFNSYTKSNENKNKIYNQLTKYYLISKVYSKDRYIDSSKVKHFILAPECKKDFCTSEKEKYYYGEKYIVTSYKKLKTTIDGFINNSNQYNNLSQDIKDIIIQFNRSIWPYISNSYTYYKRTMSNRFARVAKEIHDKNQNKKR